jgi:hypothetical protein
MRKAAAQQESFAELDRSGFTKLVSACGITLTPNPVPVEINIPADEYALLKEGCAGSGSKIEKVLEQLLVEALKSPQAGRILNAAREKRAEKLRADAQRLLARADALTASA